MRFEKLSSRPRILLLGSSGQVGGDLKILLPEFAQLHSPERAHLDLLNPESIRKYVRDISPNVIVNAAAYTAVDQAESESDIAHAINCIAPATLAEAAAREGALLIHYSTDYVFDGAKIGPYLESDAINPLNVYGRSKAAGEQAIQRSGCRHFIFRTSWVYSPRGSNFLLTMLRLASQRDELRIVNDQIGAPTSSRSIANASALIVRDVLAREREIPFSGIYHMTDSGQTSWFGFASDILQGASELLGTRLPRLSPIKTTEYPTPARRPLNSVLSCQKLCAAFTLAMPPWQQSLASVLHAVQRERQKSPAGAS